MKTNSHPHNGLGVSSCAAAKPGATLRFEPLPDFADPRLEHDFQFALWPLCNGEPAAAPDPPRLHERRCLEFLAAYYRINVLHSRLRAASATGADDNSEQLQVLAEIDSATQALEKLEDRYAPIGFYGEPEANGLPYRNILFIRPEFPRRQPKPTTLSCCFGVPGLEDIPASELSGPAKLLRTGYGQMDF